MLCYAMLCLAIRNAPQMFDLTAYTDKNRVFKNENNVDEIARNQKIMFSTRQPKTFTSSAKRMLSILEHNACDD